MTNRSNKGGIRSSKPKDIVSVIYQIDVHAHENDYV